MRNNTKRFAALMAVFIGGATLVAPGAAHADAATLSRKPLGPASYVLRFKIANDTGASMTSWRMEFDLPPGELVQGFLSLDIRVTRVDQHFILENAHPILLPPGQSIGTGIVILGLSSPLNCVTRGTPCTFDTEPPSTPTNVRIIRVTFPSTATFLQWNMSTDNVALAGYEVTTDGVGIATTTGGSYALPAAASGTVFGVRAFDEMGNRSALATAVYP
jgi:hypothetical protein